MKQERLLKIILSPHISEKATVAVEKRNEYVFQVIQSATKPEVKDAVEQLLNKVENAVVCLATVEAGQIALMCGVSKSLTAKMPANVLLQYVAQQVGGKGGGKPDLAQGGGSDVASLPKALTSVVEWVKQK